MSDSSWKRTQYNETQAAAGSVTAMASGMITLAMLNLKEGVMDAGWVVAASANNPTSYSLTADVWTDWSTISATASWIVMESPPSFASYLDSKGTLTTRSLYMLMYPSDSYYFNLVFSLSPFVFSSGARPTYGADSWGYVYSADTTSSYYANDGYTTIPTSNYTFINETIINDKGGFIFTHRGNSSGDTDYTTARIVVACMPVVNPRKGDLCPVVTYKDCGSASTSLTSSLSNTGLHLMDGSSGHRWRGIFWDGYTWKPTKMSLLGLGYTYYSDSTATGANILGPNVYPESSSNKIFAYKAMMMACSPGARFYRGNLPDIYVTPQTYTSITTGTDLGNSTVSRYSLNNLSVLPDTTNHIILNPEIKLFNSYSPPVPGYVSTSAAAQVDTTTITQADITKARRALKGALDLIEAATAAGIDTTSQDDATTAQVTDATAASDIDTPKDALFGSLTFDVDADGDIYYIKGVMINPGSTGYIYLNSGNTTTAGRFRSNTTNSIEVPGTVGVESDLEVDTSGWSSIGAYWYDSGNTVTNRSEQSDFRISSKKTPLLEITVQNISSKTNPISFSLAVDTNFISGGFQAPPEEAPPGSPIL